MSEVKTADAVVVGGGLRGLSIALYLARAGVKVVLAERRVPADMASSGNGGQVNVTGKEPDHYTILSLESARMYPEFLASLDAEIYLEQKGILHVTAEPEEMEKFRQRVAVRNRIPGLRLKLLDGKEAREIIPALSPEIIGGYISPADGLVEVLKLVPAMARAAVREGAVILKGTEVLGLEVLGGRVQGVRTSQGDIATPVVVNAAGIHVPHVGRMAGVDIPVDPEHGHLIITQPFPRLMPVPTQYITQWPNGAFLLGTTNRIAGYEKTVHPDWMPPFIQHALKTMPILKEAKALRIFAHLRPMPPDRLPIYDQVPGVEGFYVAVGHSGVTLAPVTGRVFTEWILTGRPSLDLSPYSLGRFAARSGGAPNGQ